MGSSKNQSNNGFFNKSIKQWVLPKINQTTGSSKIQSNNGFFQKSIKQRVLMHSTGSEKF
jgi:hypothetical protein